jgi:hypothetical protein
VNCRVIEIAVFVEVSPLFVIKALAFIKSSRNPLPGELHGVGVALVCEYCESLATDQIARKHLVVDKRVAEAVDCDQLIRVGVVDAFVIENHE